jgi:hypothetical protein
MATENDDDRDNENECIEISKSLFAGLTGITGELICHEDHGSHVVVTRGDLKRLQEWADRLVLDDDDVL